jgi:hypothetical protein
VAANSTSPDRRQLRAAGISSNRSLGYSHLPICKD